MQTKTMKQVGAFRMLPPAADVCQTCAVNHPAAQPHNPQSLYYQFLFYADTGRFPTWKDAMAHCADEVKKKWIVALKAKGIKL